MGFKKVAVVLALLVVACEAKVESDGEPEPTQAELDELSCAACTLAVCVGSLNRCEDRDSCEDVLQCVQDEAADSEGASDEDSNNAARHCADRHNRLEEGVWRDAVECSVMRCACDET